MAVPVFIKVTPYVARKLRLSDVRFQTADGNYLLRQSDFMIFGPLFDLPRYAAMVGGVVMRDSEAAANQRGDINTPLPAPTDPDWIDPDAAAADGMAGVGDVENDDFADNADIADNVENVETDVQAPEEPEA